MAERAYDRLSCILDTRSRTRPGDPLCLAERVPTDQRHTDLLGEGTGGFTEFVKRRVTLPLTVPITTSIMS